MLAGLARLAPRLARLAAAATRLAALAGQQTAARAIHATRGTAKHTTRAVSNGSNDTLAYIQHIHAGIGYKLQALIYGGKQTRDGSIAAAITAGHSIISNEIMLT